MLGQADLDAIVARGYRINDAMSWTPGRCYNINENGQVYGPQDISRMKQYASVDTSTLRGALSRKSTTVVPGYGIYRVCPLKASVRIGCSTFTKAGLRKVVEASDRMVRKSKKSRAQILIAVGPNLIAVEADGSVGLEYSDRREGRDTVREFAKMYL